jgi:hypothetical protein
MTKGVFILFKSSQVKKTSLFSNDYLFFKASFKALPALNLGTVTAGI